MQNKDKGQYVMHNFEPVFNKDSKILILGTMPSPKSRELGFYYGHPRNRFWKVISDVCKEQLPTTTEEKTAFCFRRQIAMWDVLKSCEICNADDSSIQNPVANDITRITKQVSLDAIFTTGTKATALYKKYCYPDTKIPSIMLPSTSPANCKISYAQLLDAYKQILDFIDMGDKIDF